jgi:flavin reductase (DIM6/NTAB) family NADH-FMN oxidoreductase RutF
MTAAWASPCSFEPPLMLVSIGHSRLTHDLLMKSKEFAINFLSEDQFELSNFCGNISGRDVDKFEEKIISTSPAEKISAPLIDNCVANVELVIKNKFPSGDHTLFIGEIVNYKDDILKKPLVRFRGQYYNVCESLGEVQHTSIEPSE